MILSWLNYKLSLQQGETGQGRRVRERKESEMRRARPPLEMSGRERLEASPHTLSKTFSLSHSQYQSRSVLRWAQ